MAKWSLALLVLLMLQSIAPSAAAAVSHDTIIEQYRALLRAGKHDEIVQEADRVIRESEAIIKDETRADEAPQAYLNMALAYSVYGKRDFAKAEAILKEAIAKYPDSDLMPAIRYYYGRNIAWGFRNTRMDGALNVFEEVARDYPKSEYAARASIERANWFRHIGEQDPAKHVEAMALYEQIATKYPDTASAAESAYALFADAMRASDLKRATRWSEHFTELSHPLAKELRARSQAQLVYAEVLTAYPALNGAMRAIDDRLEQMEDDASRVEFLAAITRANRELPADQQRWKLAAYCCERLIGIASGNTRTQAMLDLADIYFYRYRDEATRKKQRRDQALESKAMALLDQIIREQADTEWALRAEMAIALYFYHISWDVPSDTVTRGEGMSRFLAIADEHPGTPEASQALCKLANHYTVQEYFDPDKAAALALRFLHENPEANSTAYVRIVSRIMRNRCRLLEMVGPEVVERARTVILDYPHATSAEKSRFIRNASQWHGYNDVERTIDAVLAYARETNNGGLEHDALMLRGECYFKKERPQQVIDYFRKLAADRSDLLAPADQREIRDYTAMSLYWTGKYAEAVEAFETLERDAPEQSSDDAAVVARTKAYCDYMRAAALLEKGDYALSKAVFTGVLNAYPDSVWAERSSKCIDLLAPVLSPRRADESND